MSSGSGRGDYDFLLGCFLRPFWLMAGNALLALAFLQIFFSRTPFCSWLDLFFWSVVGLRIAARFADVTYFCIATAEQQAISRTGDSRVITLIVVTASVWFMAHLPAPCLPLPTD
jgi:hypothetical protein